MSVTTRILLAINILNAAIATFFFTVGWWHVGLFIAVLTVIAVALAIIEHRRGY